MSGLRERNKSRRRVAILDAAVALLRERSFAEMTVEDVAARAEVSANTVYNLVGVKDDLAYALIGRLITDVVESAPQSPTDATDPGRWFHAVTEHCVDALIADAAAYRRIVLAVSGVERWPGDGASAFRLYDRPSELLADAGLLRPGIGPRLVTRHAVFGAYAAMMAWARGGSADRFRADAHRHVAMVLAATTTGPTFERSCTVVVDPTLATTGVLHE